MPVTKSSQQRFGARRVAREWAAQILYRLDTTGSVTDLAVVDDALVQHREAFAGEELTSLPDAAPYCDRLVRGVATRLAEVDEVIRAASQHWRLDRMARVDRNVLRMAALELVEGSVPARVVINEAIEVAKKYGTEESGAFINGILDRVAQDLGRTP